MVANLYGSNELKTKLADGSNIELKQETDYPWDGKIKITITKKAKKPFDIDFRIPGWAKNAQIKVNGEKASVNTKAGSYAKLNRKWKKGDVIELFLPMPALLMEANPLVEEARNQIAVLRGPIVYCIESPDLENTSIFDVIIPSNIQLKPIKENIAGAQIALLHGDALLQNDKNWDTKLYQAINSTDGLKKVSIKLVPYFAWGNRGKSEMSVWLPVTK